MASLVEPPTKRQKLSIDAWLHILRSLGLDDRLKQSVAQQLSQYAGDVFALSREDLSFALRSVMNDQSERDMVALAIYRAMHQVEGQPKTPAARL